MQVINYTFKDMANFLAFICLERIGICLPKDSDKLPSVRKPLSKKGLIKRQIKDFEKEMKTGESRFDLGDMLGSPVGKREDQIFEKIFNKLKEKL